MLRHSGLRVLVGSRLALRWTICMTALKNGQPVNDGFLWSVSLMKNSTDNSDPPYSVILSATGIGGLDIVARAMSLFTVTIKMNSTSFAENCFRRISNTKSTPNEQSDCIHPRFPARARYHPYQRRPILIDL